MSDWGSRRRVRCGRHRDAAACGAARPPRRRASRGGAAGFTLLEVLVSLTVLAVGIALAVSLISNSLGNIRKVEKRVQIVEHAGSVLELALLDDAIQGPTALDGDFADGTRWAVRVEEHVVEDAAVRPPQNMPVKLLSYTVELSYPGSGSVDYRLRTLKLVPVQQGAGQSQATAVQDLVR